MKMRFNIFCAAALLAAISGAWNRSYAQGASELGLHTVVIDPGHGGKDPGAISKDKKTQEKDLVLDISTRLKKKIEAEHPDVKVYLTRDDDTFVTLNDRAKFASRKGADLFISVHINANDRTSPNGYSVFLLGQSSKKNTDTYAYNMDVCKRENDVILLEDDTTAYQGLNYNDPESEIFLHLMTNAYREQSLLFAELVDEKFSKGPFARSLGVLQNNLAVLRLASMPAVLLELGFISNTSDLTALRSDKSIDRMASQLASAFDSYKKVYDESVGASAPAAKPSTALAVTAASQARPEQPAVTGAPAAGEYYATQVLATKKKMDPKDSFFLGYESRWIYTGSLYKYFIGVSEDVDKAREMSAKIRKKYPDAFLVKVVDNASTRVK